MKMLMFDFRDTEKEFFDNNKLVDFDLSFIGEPLNADYKLTEEQKLETDIISVFRSSNLTDKVLKQFKNLRIIATRSYGYGHIDLDYCIEHNIAVLNVEQYGEEAVAQYAIALIIVLVRNMLPAILDMKGHKINYKHYEGKKLNNLTLGIVGCGQIGSAVAKIANYFGMRVLIHSYMQNPELDSFCDFVSLDELLSESDVISLHLLYTGDNYHLIGKEEFEKMKDGVVFVNTARGELLDIKALYDNLVTGKVKAAALDVLECEFLSTHPGELSNVIKDSESHCVETALVTQKLFNMDNVIITPHIAYNTHESVNYLLTKTFNNIRDYIKGVNTNRVC
ncbi:hydroxyacid dehydrogenase [bacterium]|nr:hydroxyacid dehydrogenase [bacterium]